MIAPHLSSKCTNDQKDVFASEIAAEVYAQVLAEPLAEEKLDSSSL